MLSTTADKTNNSTLLLSALRWVDNRLATLERRAMYTQCPSESRAMFTVATDEQFSLSDSLRVDVGMARFFARKAMIGDDKKFDPQTWTKLRDGGFEVNSIVCIGDDVASWFIVGKHFLLEVRN